LTDDFDQFITGQPTELEDFIGEMFYYPRALADGNRRIKHKNKINVK